MKSKSGNRIKQVNKFKYLGSYIDSTERDMNISITKAWSTLNSMNVIWKSSFSRKLKINFFRAAVESFQQYGRKQQQWRKRLMYVVHPNAPRCHKSTSWKDHITNQQLYGNLHKAISIIQTGHCWSLLEK